MTMIRHVLLDNHWELQCPVCHQFVAIDVDVMNGRAPFPLHQDCAYADTVNWRAEMPPTGVSALGPLEA